MSEDKGKRRRLFVFVALGVLAVVLATCAILHKPPAKKAPPHQVPVNAVRAEAQDFPVTIAGLGAAQAWISDMIFAQVTGKLIKVNFQEGSQVRAGQVLAEVDPRPYRAALDEAEGTLKRDQATLAGARRDLTRYQHLQGEGGVSRQIYEDQIATVGQDEGTVQVDKGEVAAAKLNLEFCRIVSPVSGRAGVRLVDPGNLVSASGSTSSVTNTASATSSAAAATTSTASSSASTGPTSSSSSSSGTGIVVVNQLQPIAVTFSVTQGDFQGLQAASAGFSKALTVQAVSQESGQVLDTGALYVADNRVDQSTGTVELKARFANGSNRLWPGQLVNVRLGARVLPHVTVVPLAALNRGPKGEYVFVVGAGNKVAMRTVTVDTTQGQVVVIKSGVSPGDVVVTDGQMTLDDGSLVKVAHLGAVGSPTP